MDAIAPKIKFCGLTDPTDADAAVAAGAWALGMILWPGSRRHCRVTVAAEIAAEHRRQVQLVGVFVNPTLEQVARAADEIGLTMVQLHGDEGPAFCAEVARRTGCRVIKAARVRSGADIQALGPFHTDFHLLDSYVADRRGGTRRDVRLGARALPPPGRARDPVRRPERRQRRRGDRRGASVSPSTSPAASSSRPGRKDHDKLEAFAAAVAATAPPESRGVSRRGGRAERRWRTA